MRAWAQINDEGFASPIWFSEQPGAEELDFPEIESADALIEFLAGHRRTDAGEWVPRDPVKPVEPTAEELAAMAEADYQARLAAWNAEVDAAIVASPVYRQFIRGEMTLTAYREAAADITASIPKPER
jgi:hypothetical protein